MALITDSGMDEMPRDGSQILVHGKYGFTIIVWRPKHNAFVPQACTVGNLDAWWPLDEMRRHADAAPNLLAALKALDEALCDGFETQAARMSGRKALIAARAAIAKSEGR